jgi:hypothetical protein
MLTARIHAFEESSHGTLQSSLGSLMHDRTGSVADYGNLTEAK